MHLVHPIYYIVYSCVGVRIRVRMWVRYHTASHLSRSFLLLILGTEKIFCIKILFVTIICHSAPNAWGTK